MIIQKIKKLWADKSYKQYLTVQNIGMYIFGFLTLLVSWTGAKVISQNYELQKKIAKFEQQNDVIDVENQNQKLRNEFFKTEYYQEFAARKQLGKSAPGEKVYVVPNSIALKHSTDILPKTVEVSASKIEKPWYQENFDVWMDFLFHR